MTSFPSIARRYRWISRITCSGMLLASVVAVILMALLTTLSNAQDALGEDFSKRPQIEKRLAAAQGELGKLSDADAVLHDHLQQLTVTCQYHLAAVNVLEKARIARDQAEKDLNAWRGFPQPPPYSILLLDEIRETLANLETSRSAGEAQIRIFTAEIEAARDKLDAHQQTERRFAEAVQSAATPEARESSSRAAKAEEVSSRIAAEQIARINLRLAAQRAELEMFRFKTDLAKLQLAAIQGKTRLTPQDLESIQQRIANERAEAVAKLTAAGAAGTQPDPLLAWKIEFLDLEKNFWSTRAEALGLKNSASRKTALSTLAEMKKRVDDWMEIARLRIAGGTASAAELDPAELRNAIQRAGKMQRLIAFTIVDLEGGHLKTPIIDSVSSALLSLWDTEIYLAEEVEIVDGNKTTTYRAVTLGKLVRLVIILLVGWMILQFVARSVKSLVSRRSTIPQTTADLAAKVTIIVGLALLILYGLNAVRIPLTALAFLGGALAIGIGFGTQTILKNFISGLILIFERPLRVGDYVEVDGVAGTIRTIGMRASVIHHGNGIDTVIPNSNLLENKVTNWTFSDSLLRHSVRIGVEHGSPTRDVAKTLLAVASEHGLVLDHPAPEVCFENFGEKSLDFSLLFWFDIGKTTRDQLASDLRHMIERAFAESNIRIASPRDDVRFDHETHLRVEVSHSPKTEQ
jgi:small-conductance mechanosensitive channel